MKSEGITALITGASGGIGMELARIHATYGGNLVLVARSKEKLVQLKQELETNYAVNVYLIIKDLALPGAPEEVYNEISRQGIMIDYLINNAGFGDFGRFYETDRLKEERMIHLNIHALTILSKLFLQDMVQRGKGRIMNVASTAAFQPGPYMAVYSATKAYVLSFSEAVNHELRKKGITITALCPGPTESGFMEASSLKESKLFKNKRVPSAKTVAQYGYRAMMNGKPVAIHGLYNSVLANSVRFAPRSLVVQIARKIIEAKK